MNERDLGIVNETVAGPCIGRQLSSARQLQALYNCLPKKKEKSIQQIPLIRYIQNNKWTNKVKRRDGEINQSINYGFASAVGADD